MLAQSNEYLQEAVSGVRQLTAEEQIRLQCQAREDYLYWERIRNARTEHLKSQLNDTQTELASKSAELASKDDTIANMAQELEELRAFKAAHSATV